MIAVQCTGCDHLGPEIAMRHPDDSGAAFLAARAWNAGVLPAVGQHRH